MNNQNTNGLIWITSIDPRDTWVEDHLPSTPLVWRSPVNGDKWYVYRNSQGLPPETYWWLDQGLSGHMVSTDFLEMDIEPIAGVPDFSVPTSDLSFMEDNSGTSYAV